MSKRLRTLGRLALVAVILFCGMIAWFLTYRATQAHSFASGVLLPALASARSVTVSDHIPYEVFTDDAVIDKEWVPRSVTLSSSQIAELSRAVAGHFDYGRSKVPLCYRPPFHHIEIICADGALRRFDVSFYCGIFEYERHRHPLPTLLFGRLRDCFTRFGIPPHSKESYADLRSRAEKH